ncbi:hypothetical protein CV102_19320 [Natronococcus pandeyae]|uniref:Uncharacterized protein n=1 Tax=Natronococcus pandeyae TaxID=2055836 RepID=A0A8J8Q1T2_9EURY|nr:hypothetical protein [Natronococcus pandeyae]TYL36913.1 hypothetical protein CV102_19320 [Natronococcus pandeyae]
MTTLESLPAIESCLETYRVAYASFDERPFSTAELADHEDGPESSASDLEYRLTLLVAYGLVDRIDDDRYRVRCSPDESPARWRERAAERAETLHRLITASTATQRPATAEPDPGRLKRDDDTFASVFVGGHDDVDSVATAAATALDGGDALAGIVLRTSGARADRAQRIADHLCAPEITDRTDLDSSFEKGFSDVVGDSKDELEFRLFLRTA